LSVTAHFPAGSEISLISTDYAKTLINSDKQIGEKVENSKRDQLEEKIEVKARVSAEENIAVPLKSFENQAGIDSEDEEISFDERPESLAEIDAQTQEKKFILASRQILYR
jgi:hypothetical protein